MQSNASHMIDGVPSVRLKAAPVGECFIACTHMVMQYHASVLGIRFDLTYEVLREECSFLLEGTGLPPGRIDELVRIASRLVPNGFDLAVEYLEDLTVNDIEGYTSKNQPLILIYDWQMYMRQIPTKDNHCSVLVGYNPYNIIVNDDIHGGAWAMERVRFLESWQRKYNKAIFIHPNVPIMSLDKWSRSNVTGNQ